MKLILDTPQGQLELLPTGDTTVKELQESFETPDLTHITIQTKEGPVILLSKCARQSMIRIIKDP